MVVALVGGMVADPSLAEVGLGDQAQPLEEFKGAVDGGNVNVGVLSGNLGIGNKGG